MGIKSQSRVYDRLEKLIYEFSAEQDKQVSGLNGRETTEIIVERFVKWIEAGAIESIRNDEKSRTGTFSL